jgi:hypothetical protein
MRLECAFTSEVFTQHEYATRFTCHTGMLSGDTILPTVHSQGRNDVP